MKLMEYQAQTLLKQQGVPVMRGCVVDCLQQLDQAIDAAQLRYPVVIKAQVQIGGRGKAGGIQFAENIEQARAHAQRLLGSTLRGYRVNKLYIVEKASYENEWYLSIMLDRLSKQPLILFSSMGGVEIEDTAKTHPESSRESS